MTSGGASASYGMGGQNVTVADVARPEAAASVKRLGGLGVRRVVMFTGDRPEIAAGGLHAYDGHLHDTDPAARAAVRAVKRPLTRPSAPSGSRCPGP